MEEKYPVFINLKIRWLTKTSYYLFIVCLVVLWLFGLYMLPSEHSADEMKAAYFVLTTSELEKIVFGLAVVGTPTFFILYRYSRIKRKAVLTLLSDRIEIDNFKTVITVPTNDITKIACNDALTSDGFPKAKLTIDFKEKNENVVSVTLIDYSQSEKLMDKLLSYENIKFNVTNFSSNPEVLDE
jgi:hypothetical protein